MDGVNECVIEWIKGEEVANVTAANRTRLKGRILKLAEQFPEEVKIIAQNSDGSVFAHVPMKWVRINKPPQREFSDEQRAATAERMRAMREAQKAAKAALQ